MTEMVDDDEIYEGFTDVPYSDNENRIVSKVMFVWAEALEKLPANEKSLKVVFAACVNMIATMGPAYCRVAAVTLMRHADEQDEEDET